MTQDSAETGSRWVRSSVRRRFGAAALVVTAGLVVAACGSTSTTSPTTSPSPSDASSDNPDNTPLPSQTPAPGAQTVHIAEGEMYIHSDVSSFKVGQPYCFIVHNEGKIVHEFTIAHKVPGGNQDQRDAASVLDMDGLQGRQTTTFNYTFAQPAPSVGMEFECSYPGHYEMSMHMDISVTT